MNDKMLLSWYGDQLLSHVGSDSCHVWQVPISSRNIYVCLVLVFYTTGIWSRFRKACALPWLTLGFCCMKGSSLNIYFVGFGFQVVSQLKVRSFFSDAKVRWIILRCECLIFYMLSAMLFFSAHPTTFSSLQFMDFWNSVIVYMRKIPRKCQG